MTDFEDRALELMEEIIRQIKDVQIAVLELSLDIKLSRGARADAPYRREDET